jgi:hypothetical protein
MKVYFIGIPINRQDLLKALTDIVVFTKKVSSMYFNGEIYV